MRTRLSSSGLDPLTEAGFRADVIERQLAHSDCNKVRAAYNHAQHLPERKRLMQAWAGMVDAARDGATVIPGRFGKQRSFTSACRKPACHLELHRRHVT